MTTTIGSTGALPDTLESSRQTCARGNVVVDPVSIDPSSPALQETSFPDQIKIWPQIIMSAAQQKLGGAVRVWEFAKALDESGSGVVDKYRLLAYMIHLGVPAASRYRWLRSASQNQLLRPIRNDSQFLILSIQNTGRLINVKDIGQRCVIPALFLSGRHWKSKVWDLILVQFKNRPISRASLCQITGVPVRTQIELERSGKVAVQQNWCMTSVNAALITPYTEFARSHAFVAQINKHPYIVYQMPNHYNVPSLSGTPDGGNYRRKTYTAASASVKSDNPECQFSVVRCSQNTLRVGGARCERVYRVYFDREKPFSRALRRLGRNGIDGTLYRKICVPKSKTNNGWYFEEQI